MNTEPLALTKEDWTKRDQRKVDYVLLQDIDWFGKRIYKGTIYKQINADYWYPIINHAHCPSLQIDFYTTRNNTHYFLEIQP